MKQKIVLHILILFAFTYAKNNFTQELPIGMTAEEETRIDEIYSMGRDTDPPPIPIRNIAEYERMQGVLIRYPFGISTDIIAEISESEKIFCLVSSNLQNSAITSMENGDVNMENVELVIGATDSYWTRDYGPWWVVDGDRNVSIVDFTYNRPRPNDNDAPLKISNHLDVPYYASDIVHTGGNYMTDGMGTAASTDIVYEENTIPDEDVLSKMEEYYGINTYHVLEDPNNTYIDHIDCWGKYLSPTKVLIREVPDTHPQYSAIEETAEYFSSSLNEWGEPWELHRVWTPGNQPYTNSLIINKKVLIPVTGGSWDDEALEVYENALPGYEILGFSGTWESTDALHCRIKGIPDLNMLQIFHNPLNNGTEPANDGYLIEAMVDNLSSSGLIVDSMKVFWKESESINWLSHHLYQSDSSDNSNIWMGNMPALSDTGIIQYFIQAADSSGRIETSPMAGWHSFIAAPTEACLAWSIGDLDNSGDLNILDILLLSDMISSSASGICPESISDINNDGSVSVMDIVFLVNIILNL
ncbi:MAG: agmatine deiminase family protein [Candidatus Neomarinimicrobiota bacterium]